MPPQPLDARDAARTAVLAALDGSGAVILGSAGIGKTTLAREAVDLCSHGFPVLLRGSTLSARTPYGALAWLLSDLPPEELANPVRVRRALESLLVRQAAGRRIILVIDNAEEIDDLGALVTADLCRRGTVALVLVCGDLIRCHRDYVRLWTDGALKRVDLAPLDLRHTAELLAAAAGGPLTSMAQQVLWLQSRGNPLLASLLCRDLIAAKSLTRQSGFWTWAGPLVHSGELPERVETVLRRFTPGERHAVEILALCRELPLEVVLELVPAHTMDALEEASLVTISGGRGQPVRLAWILQPATIAARIPFGRSRDLWAEVTRVVNVHGLTGAAGAGLAAWSLSVGIALEPEMALAAARWSNETGDTVEAVRYSRAGAGPRPLSVVLEEAAALRAEGRHAQAHRILVAAEKGSGVSAELWIEFLVARALASARTCGSADDPWPLLVQAGQLLPEDSGVCPGPGLRISLARAEVLSVEGRLRRVPASLADDFQDPAAPPAARLWAGIRLAQQHAGAGRFAETTELVSQIRTRLETGIRTDVRTRELLFHHLFFLLLRCGELGEALALTESASVPGNRSGLRTSTGTELPTGLVHAYAGRGGAALDFLIPAIAQLQAHDPDKMLPLASAVAAYSRRLTRQTGTAAEVELSPEPQSRTDPPSAAAVRYFRILSGPTGPAGEPSARAEALHAHAVRALAEENVPDALLSHAAAALLGHQSAVADLAAAASRANGTLASGFQKLAVGLMNKDVSVLIEAGEAALRQQNTRLAHQVSLAAGVLAAEGGSRTMLRRVRQLEYESFRDLSPVNSVHHGLAQLEDFERELALRAATGETSAVLGRRFHLSARTVDWHLGRVFARLHVSGRSDLQSALLVPDEHTGTRGGGT
ncbi:AAA family ATPase [Arthrobacter sp. UYP6]|uniref:AAA family ATPase n=1 Tax=Arthrobacter sp. UYP6 TaxID=1756378 RepID=UPI003390B44D